MAYRFDSLKRYTFEAELNSPEELKIVESTLRNQEISRRDIDILSVSSKNSKGFHIRRIRKNLKMAVRGWLIGLVIGAWIGTLFEGHVQTQVGSLFIEGIWARTLVFGQIGAHIGFAMFYLLGWKVRGYEIHYDRAGGERTPQVLLAVNTRWEDEAKVRAALNQALGLLCLWCFGGCLQGFLTVHSWV
ncbi:MAG: hypothetical protein KDD22_07605 [Bdellovibrionales bacterium]|nr:hypothetical protein [Bdellovibrionales bacterium]